MSAVEIQIDPNLLSVYLSDKKVHNYAWGAFAAGFFPGSGLELAGVYGIQLMLIKRLGDGYGVEFKTEAAKKILIPLLGSILPTQFGNGLAGWVMRGVPVVGPYLGLLVSPGFDYFSTVAVGRVFDKHFSSGGNYLKFDLESMKAQMTREYNEAKAGIRSLSTKLSGAADKEGDEPKASATETPEAQAAVKTMMVEHSQLKQEVGKLNDKVDVVLAQLTQIAASSGPRSKA